MPNIYIAGKIRQDRNLRQVVDCNVNNVGEYLRTTSVEIDDYFTYVGPFVIGCDHGCFHGPASHGVGVPGEGCVEVFEERLKESLVYDQCIKQITNCDIFLAWIDEPDCYGSMVELGYASYARIFGKRVYIAFQSSSFEDDTLYNDFWFVRQFGVNLGCLNDISSALNVIRCREE